MHKFLLASELIKHNSLPFASLPMALHRLASKAGLVHAHQNHPSSASPPLTPSHIHLLCLIILLFLVMILLILSFSNPGLGAAEFVYSGRTSTVAPRRLQRRMYLYWGNQIDCPGKHCASPCAGLGHQESSLRCALEEALVLNRTYVMPSRMCINQLHNHKGFLHESSNGQQFSSWGTDSCTMESLYDLDLVSQKVRVILDSSTEWLLAVSMARQLEALVHVQDIGRMELKQNNLYNNAVIINRTASPLSWFVECKNRKDHSTVLLPFSFLPTVAAKPLRLAAERIKRLLGDYDGIHVRRGDKLKTRKDRFGVNRTLLPHLDRDTRPHAIMQRIANWIPEGRTIFIASNEKTPGFFDPLTSRYKVVLSSNFTTVLDPVVQNNYQLFMVERLVLMGAKIFVKTFKEDPSDFSLTDDGKKQIRSWEIPVYTFDGSSPQSSS